MILLDFAQQDKYALIKQKLNSISVALKSASQASDIRTKVILIDERTVVVMTVVIRAIKGALLVVRKVYAPATV